MNIFEEAYESVVSFIDSATDSLPEIHFEVSFDTHVECELNWNEDED